MSTIDEECEEKFEDDNDITSKKIRSVDGYWSRESSCRRGKRNISYR